MKKIKALSLILIVALYFSVKWARSNLDEKRERLITSEIDSNNELVNLNLQAYLAPRKKACEEFNEKFGLYGENAINVKVRSDLYNIIKQAESITDEYRDMLRTDDVLSTGEGETNG